MFDADRPILKSSEDRINRATFAKYLARSILDHHDSESFVIGLYGGFGVGKTSIINLILEEFNLADPNIADLEKPIILNFKAWSYSGQNQLIYSFFRRLSAVLRDVSYLEHADRIIYLLELYVSFFTHKPIPTAFRKKPSFWQKLFSKKNVEDYAWESGRDLTLVKAELNELLALQKHKIIIIIDNISQLYDYEINQILQIVKSMGDFSNTAYLLAFDKNHVVRALNKIHHGDGEELLAKIIQSPFEIPPILQQDLENIFNGKLHEVLNMVPIDAWSSEYWLNLYHDSLKLFFQNCRDIARYINTLKFSYPRMADIVNPVDFFALTAIQVFFPYVYTGIRDNKDLFSDLLDNVYLLDDDVIDQDRKRCDSILESIPNHFKQPMMQLLMKLFPRLRHLYQPNISFYHSDALARKFRRISSPDLFDAYFRLSMQPSQISAAELATILKLAAEEMGFDQAITRLNQDDRINKFLDQLDSHIANDIPLKNIGNIITALLDNGDLFPQGISSAVTLDTPMRIHRIIFRLLKRLPHSEERFLILQHAIASANKSLYILIHELIEQGREHIQEEDTYLAEEFRILSPQELTSLRLLVISRIEYWAKTGRLADHPRLRAILFIWREWAGEKACKQFVRHLVKTDKGLVTFLTTFLSQPIEEAMTEYIKNPEWEDYLEDIRSFVSIKKTVALAKILFEDPYFEKLREKEQLALMIFLDLTKTSTIKEIPQTI